jgi:hypothetical protein
VRKAAWQVQIALRPVRNEEVDRRPKEIRLRAIAQRRRQPGPAAGGQVELDAAA